MKAIRTAAVIAALMAALTVRSQEALRPEVGKPLQAAEALIKSGKYRQALAKVHEADGVANRSASENYMIERMRIAAASGAGDADTAARAFDAIAATGRASAADKARMAESIAGGYYRAKDYAKAMQWSQRYFKEGGTNPAIRTLLIQSQYLSGDFAGAARELTTEIQGAEKAGRAPGEDRLKLLLNAAVQLKDNNAYVYAVEKLVTYYPKKEYWVDLLSRMQRKPGFSDRLVLDTYRLSLATGSMSAAGDFMEMGQLALQAGNAAEAKRVVDMGFASGILGQGAEGERHKRLRDLIAKRLEEAKAGQEEAVKEAQAAKDGNGLLALGFAEVLGGDKAAGLKMMRLGVTKGGLKRPEDAKLHLGIAQVLAGDPKGPATLHTVGGKDGTADLARLWMLYAKRRN